MRHPNISEITHSSICRVRMTSGRLWQARTAVPRSWGLPFVVWVAVFGFLALTSWAGAASWPDAIQLARHGERTVATIVKLEPANHGGCEYSYSVGAKHYSRSTGACNGIVGSPVFVTYLPERPSVSYVGAPGAALRKQVLVGLGVPTLLAALLAIVVWRSRRAS